MSYTIEQNVEPPVSKAAEITNVLKTMKASESVVFPRDEEPSWRAAAGRCGVCVTVRRINPTQCRLWRNN